jgi:starvation-inducible outer membrane lipoprotein
MDRLQDFINWFFDQSLRNKIGMIIATAVAIILIALLVFNLVYADAPLTGNALTQYEASCISVGYQELSTNIGKYNGQHVKFSGKVVTINSNNGKTQIVLSVTPVNGGWSTSDLISVNYNAQTQFKAGDIVTVYGDVAGTYNYVSISNGQLIIPKITARYIELTPIAVQNVVSVPFTSPSNNQTNSSNQGTSANIPPINSSTPTSNPNNSNTNPI